MKLMYQSIADIQTLSENRMCFNAISRFVTQLDLFINEDKKDNLEVSITYFWACIRRIALDTLCQGYIFRKI